MTDELIEISDKMERISGLFVTDRNLGKFLPTEHSSRFKALCIEAKAILDHELGALNDFSNALLIASCFGDGLVGGPSYARVMDAIEALRIAPQIISRKKNSALAGTRTVPDYIDPSRITGLERISKDNYDFSRLIAMCRELNIAAANNCHISMTMLQRAMIDHVPPSLGKVNFTEVANNYGEANSNRSFKKSMQNLEKSLRNITDAQLHVKIREKESLPTFNQVNFSADLDVLLAEIIRLNSKEN